LKHHRHHHLLKVQQQQQHLFAKMAATIIESCHPNSTLNLTSQCRH